MYEDILCRNKEFTINEHIIFRQPTVSEILDFGEERYWQMISTFCITPADIKHILFDKFKLYFDEVDEFTVFRMFINSVTTESASILFKKFDLDSLESGIREDIDEKVLFCPKTGMVVDKSIYQMIVDYIREMHNLPTPIYEKAGNETTRQVMIDLAREDAKNASEQPFRSMIIPKGMFLCNTSECKYNYETVWDLPIYVFLSSYQIIIKNKHIDNKSKAFFNNVYSNYESLKKFDHKDLIYSGEPK